METINTIALADGELNFLEEITYSCSIC